MRNGPDLFSQLCLQTTSTYFAAFKRCHQFFKNKTIEEPTLSLRKIMCLNKSRKPQF